MNDEEAEAIVIAEYEAHIAALERKVGQLTMKLDLVKKTPSQPIAAWRVRLAAARLRRGDGPLPRIAQSLGYASDSAFAASFRRILGHSPGRYRDLHRGAAQSGSA